MKLFTYRYFQCSRAINSNLKVNLVSRFHVMANKTHEPLCSYYLESFGSRSILNTYENLSQPRNCIRKFSINSVIETYIGVFHALSESKVVAASQNFLVNVHDTSGLPWWATVAVSTVVLRGTITLPLALYQKYILAKLENIQVEFVPIVQEIHKEMEIATKMYNWSPTTAKLVFLRAFRKQWKVLIERDNCHPLKAGIVVLFQFPMWVLLSMSIRNLISMRPHQTDAAVEIFEQMKHEGLLWIPNLTVPDETMIISGLLSLVTLSIVEINRLMFIKKQTRLNKIVVNISRGFAVIIFPVSLIAPSCLSFYWLTSATVGLCQTLIVMSPRVKLLAGIPQTPTTMKHPYTHLWKQIQNSLNVIKTPKV